jgi:hypothetical protein
MEPREASPPSSKDTVTVKRAKFLAKRRKIMHEFPSMGIYIICICICTYGSDLPTFGHGLVPSIPHKFQLLIPLSVMFSHSTAWFSPSVSKDVIDLWSIWQKTLSRTHLLSSSPCSSFHPFILSSFHPFIH